MGWQPSILFLQSSIVPLIHSVPRTVNIGADHLAPVVPSRGDNVKVILGDEDKEQTGQLLIIDSQEGVIKLDHSGILKILQLKYLCKMKSDDKESKQ